MKTPTHSPRIVIEEHATSRWYMGITGTRQQAEIVYNQFMNWGVIDPHTELTEQGETFFYFTIKPSKLFAYYVMRYAQKYSRLHKKGQRGGIAPLAKQLATDKINRIPRESITPFIMTNNRDFVAKQGFALGFLSHKSDGAEE